MNDSKPSQSEKFRQAARELECDDDPERFADRLRQLVKHKPAKDGAGGGT